MKRVYAVGLGPGGREYITPQAMAAMEEAEVLCGYSVYVDLIRDLFPGKACFTTGMRGEQERCRRALELSAEGKTVAVVCSGDSGVYGMAGLLLELGARFPEVEIQVVPGVTAALSGAAVLGSPLTGDFCVISLSDLLTPWETIGRRLRAAAFGDFPVVLYNPASRTRRDHLRRAVDILLLEKSPETLCGWVRNIGREGQQHEILTLRELREAELDMFTTVFVGARETRLVGGRLVTPRGYEVTV